jgi:hypothetical protein
MTILLLYPLLTAALYYLGSRAKITSWLWSKYPPALASFMDCAACTGFWYGFLVECVYGGAEPMFAPYALTEPFRVGLSAITVGLCSLVLTPIVANVMQNSLFMLGTPLPETPGDTTVSPSGDGTNP